MIKNSCYKRWCRRPSIGEDLQHDTSLSGDECATVGKRFKLESHISYGHVNSMGALKGGPVDDVLLDWATTAVSHRG